jgi:hypothetical protein
VRHAEAPRRHVSCARRTLVCMRYERIIKIWNGVCARQVSGLRQSYYQQKKKLFARKCFPMKRQYPTRVLCVPGYGLQSKKRCTLTEPTRDWGCQYKAGLFRLWARLGTVCVSIRKNSEGHAMLSSGRSLSLAIVRNALRTKFKV